MEELAESLYEAHRNPIVKLDSTGSKLYLLKSSDEEKVLVATAIGALKKSLEFPRIDRRCGRSLGIWLEDKQLVKVIKKHYQNYGFQDKTGIYLYPEEALFLIETNKLEIQWKDVPISIQQAYSLIIKDETLSWDNYKIYKLLASEGYKIAKPKKSKALTDDVKEPEQKKVKLDSNSGNNLSLVYLNDVSTDCNYKIYNHKIEDHFDIRIIGNDELDPKLCVLENSAKTLYGISLPNNETFYRFARVEIPDISNDEPV